METPATMSRRAIMKRGHRYTSIFNMQIATERELNGFYLYAWASGPFYNTALNFLIVLATEQAKRHAIDNSGWILQTPRGEPCMVEGDGCYREPKDPSIIFGVSYSSFIYVCTLTSMTCQLLMFLTIVPFADYEDYR